MRPLYFVCTMILSQPLERAFLVLLDLSAAFDTIDHDNLFYILEKYVGIGGSALRLIRSYFSDRTQRVQIDGIMSDFASLLCGVPQGSVLGPMKFCLYLLPLGAILRHHNIGYHIYADDTQLYISFKCKDPLESMTLSVSVGDMQVSPSSKVRDLGVVFDQYLTFHDHISGICKSTHFHLRGIGRIRNLLTFDATAQLIHAAPNDTAYKRCSCHSGFKLLCKLCRTSPPPAMGS